MEAAVDRFMDSFSSSFANPLTEVLPAPLERILGPEVAGNSLLQWGVALGAALVTFLLLRLLRRFVGRRLQRMAEKTQTDFDDLAVELVERTQGWFLLVAAVLAGSAVLDLSQAVRGRLQSLLFIAALLQAGLWAVHVLRFLIRRKVEHRAPDDASSLAVVSLLSFVSQVVIWSLVVLLSLDNLGFDVTALVAGLGVGGIAVGLALQNVLQDTFASLSIILDKPFVVGDFIVVGDLLGSVEKIGIKTTRLRSLSGEQLVFGNSDLLGSRIRNYKKLVERRILFTFGVIYQTPAEKLEAIPGWVREIIEGLETVRFDRAHFKEYGDSSLVFEVVYYVLQPEYEIYMDRQQTINLALFRRFEAEGIELAYPTRTLYLAGAEGLGVRTEATAAAGRTGVSDRPPPEPEG